VSWRAASSSFGSGAAAVTDVSAALRSAGRPAADVSWSTGFAVPSFFASDHASDALTFSCLFGPSVQIALLCASSILTLPSPPVSTTSSAATVAPFASGLPATVTVPVTSSTVPAGAPACAAGASLFLLQPTTVTATRPTSTARSMA
jgi:hypothetical protein